MENEYTIHADNTAVGMAMVRRQGLYCHIRCRCKPPGNAVHRLYAVVGGKRTDLGICVPVDGAFGLDTKIPIKRIGEGVPSFYIAPNRPNHMEQFIPVCEQMPFPCIGKLRSASLEHREGQMGLVFKMSAPAQPDSDLTPAPQSR